MNICILIRAVNIRSHRSVADVFITNNLKHPRMSIRHEAGPKEIDSHPRNLQKLKLSHFIMTMYSSIKSFLNAPFPVNASYKVAFWRALGVSFFVSLFLVFFQPFGLSLIEGKYRLLIIASFGLPSFPVILISSIIAVYVFRRYDWEKHWKIWHEILLTMSIPLLIGLANYGNGCLVLDWQFSWKHLLLMEFETMLVGYFPIVGAISMNWMFMLRKHQKLATLFDLRVTNSPSTKAPDDREIILEGENKQETVHLNANELLFIKAEGNYVDVVTMNQEGRSGNHLLRNSLRAIETQLNPWNASIVRCHRSYLVNCNRINQVKGNAQGLILTFDFAGQEVPVSRKYVSCFRESCSEKRNIPVNN